MRYHLIHSTEYRYAAPVQTARHLLHLSPRPCAWQTVIGQQLHIDPAPTTRRETHDVFGNPLTRVELAFPHEKLIVESDVIIDVDTRPWLALLVAEKPWEQVGELLSYRAERLSEPFADAQRMRFESPGVRVKRELEAYARQSFGPQRPLVDATRDLMARIHREFRYDPDATEVGTSVLEILQKKHGVCQDFAHLMVGCLRSLGLAARYVSGYLRTDPPPGQPRMTGADASHAWAAVFVPDIGWVEFDPTNDCLADERHIVLAWGRDFGDVSPIRGVIQGGGDHTLKVAVTVTPLTAEDSRATNKAVSGER